MRVNCFKHIFTVKIRENGEENVSQVILGNEYGYFHQLPTAGHKSWSTEGRYGDMVNV